MKKLILPLLTITSFAGFASMSELSNEELAQEAANCYVYHEVANSELYKSGEVEELRNVITKLVGSGDVNKFINIAARKQRGSTVSASSMPKKKIAKHCSYFDDEFLETN